MNAPDKIRAWVARNFNPNQVDKVTQDLVDVATGNKTGNKFENEALKKIFPEWNKNLGETITVDGQKYKRMVQKGLLVGVGSPSVGNRMDAVNRLKTKLDGIGLTGVRIHDDGVMVDDTPDNRNALREMRFRFEQKESK